MIRPRIAVVCAVLFTAIRVAMGAARSAPAARWRWQVAARALTAIAGGYALTALAASTLAVLAVALGLPRVEAALAAMLASFSLYCGAIVWSFGAATLARLWATLAIVTTLLWMVRAVALALG
jgi:hypothetical protein